MAALGFFSYAKISKKEKNYFIVINVMLILFDLIVYFKH